MALERDPMHMRRLWLYAWVALVVIFLVAPILIVIPMSFSGGEFLEFPPSSWSLRWYNTYIGSLDWREATLVSFRTAILTAAVSTPIGVLAAYGLHSATSARASLVRTAIMTPLILPVILIAIGTFYLYAKLNLLNTTLGLVLAHSVLAVPFVVVTVSARFEQYDFTQELVARSLGASRAGAFFRVTLPQIRAAVVTGALFAFITSFDEAVIALFISGGEQSTLTRRMFVSLRDQIDPTIAAISSILIVLSVVVLTAAQFAARAPGSRAGRTGESDKQVGGK